jgi:hypothetical protein
MANRAGVSRIIWLCLSLCAITGHALAWDDFGHMQVAAVAYSRLSPLARKRCAELLKMNPRYANWTGGFTPAEADRVAFVVAATWADGIKNDPAYVDDTPPSEPTASQNVGYADKLRHKYWHFIDVPFSPDGTPLVQPSTPNIQTQIHTFRAALADPALSEDIKSYDLTWLLHLVGDVHQPLHCASRVDQQDPHGDQGGNAVQIQGNQPPSICDDPRFCLKPPSASLHIFYDDITGDSCCVTEALAASRRLPHPKPAQLDVTDEAAWVQQSSELAQTAVYVAPIGVGHGPFTVDAAYAKAALELGRQQIALAGARLAKLLNAAFAEEKAARHR